MSNKVIVCGDFKAQLLQGISFSKDIKEWFNKAGCCICNFEAPVLSSGIRTPKSGPSLYQDVNAPQFLMDNGFNAILLANNHIMDYGQEGCLETIQAFTKALCVGAGMAKDAYQVKTIEVGGKLIGLLSATQHEFGVVENKDGGMEYGAAWINSLDIEGCIKESKSEVDYLFVFPHAGMEHTDAPLPGWRRIYRRFIDWGADIVIASHPHCPQGWEIFRDKYIFYSLGNFYWDCVKNFNHWNNSIAVEIEVGDSLKINPRFLRFDINHQISIDNSEQTLEHINYLNSLLEDNKRYEKYIEDVCRSSYEGMKYGLLRGVGGTTVHIKFYWFLRLLGLMILGNKDETYLLNLFQNESHRWVIEHYLKNKIGKQ